MGRKVFWSGVVVGAGLMYFLDAERGMERRSRVRGRLARLRADLEAGGVLQGGLVSLGAGAAALRHRRGDIEGLDAHLLRSGRSGPGRINASSAAVGVAGGALAMFGLARRGRVGGAMRTLGTTMLAAGLKDLEATPPGFLRERRRAVDAQHSIEIALPPEAVYGFWRDYENFPLFLSHVRQVTDLGDGRSHWTGNGATGDPVHWTAVITDDEPGRALGWRSEPDSSVEHSGGVRFTPAGGGTRVDVRVSCAPSGLRGSATTDLLGADPDSRLEADLSRVKLLLESTEGGS